MTPESITTALPYVLALTIVIGFLAALTVGLGMAMSLFFLQGMVSALRKFHTNMDQAQQTFEELQKSTHAQIQSQARLSEAFHRRRKEQFGEEDGPEDPRKAASYPNFTQDWRANATPKA